MERKKDRLSPLAAIFLLGCHANVNKNNDFRGKLKSSRGYHRSKINKKIREGVDSRVEFVWRFRVMGSRRIR